LVVVKNKDYLPSAATSNRAKSCNVAELQFFVPNTHLVPVSITNSWKGAQLILSLPGSVALLTATNLAGPWTTNASATSPFAVPTAGAQQFFQIQF
jgi:hypothetical protein